MDIKELKERKKALKITTAQLAYLAGLPSSTVSKIMTGETKNPSYITIEKIDKALLHEEIIKRIEAYAIALKDYYNNLDDEEEYDDEKFEKEYRNNNNLDEAPIPFAKKKDTATLEGNLAVDYSSRVTIEQLAMFGEDKNMELINGRIIFGQAPGINHQILVQNIGKVIDRFIDSNNGSCRMFNVGINVLIDEDDYSLLVPDLVILCDESKLREDGIYGAPDFILEVVSKSSRRRDYNDKMHKYMQAGVQEYWIVDPDKLRVTVYVAGEPMMAYMYGFEDEIPVGIYGGKLKLCIGKLTHI